MSAPCWSTFNPWEAAAVHDLGWPVVSLGATAPDLPSVDPENEVGAAGAARHLLARGRRRIATIACPDRNPCARERLAWLPVRDAHRRVP